MMLPIGGKETIARVIDRTSKAETIDEVVVATSDKQRDNLLANRAYEAGVSVHRGDEDDVLGRVLDAAVAVDADIIVRIAGDCPAVSPDIIDHTVKKLYNNNADYVSNKLKRTFPLGLDVEAFTRKSFDSVNQAAIKPNEREHVTLYYLDHRDLFTSYNINSNEFFEETRFQDRTDIEIVLDEAEDYTYLNTIFSELPDDEPNVTSIIDYIDEHNLMDEISAVQRKTKQDVEDR
jgi:spore coat polysaccharide biosynthesis protein SpsF